MIELQISVQELLVVQESGDCMSDEVCYSGYVEHSDFYIEPQSYQEAFDFLCQLAAESEEDGYNFELDEVVRFEWDKYRGDWVNRYD